MTDLPPGWEWATLEDLAGPMARAITDGPFGSNLKSEHYTQDGARVIRLQNIGDGHFRDERAYISLERFEKLRNHEVHTGDLVVASLGEKPPRVCLVPALDAPAIVKADCIRVRLSSHIDSRWVLYTLTSPQTKKFAANLIRGVGRPRLGLPQIRVLRVPVPPLAEQRRIVDALEDYFSRIEAGSRSTSVTRSRFLELRHSELIDLRSFVTRRSATFTPLWKVADTSLGKMIDAKRNVGTPTPYLRNANVQWGKFDLSDILYAQMSEQEVARLRLRKGDLMVCEGGQPGRCAVWQDSETLMTYQKALHRVRPHEGVIAEWLSIMIEEAVRSGRTAEMLTGTTIKHLSQEKLRRSYSPGSAVACGAGVTACGVSA